MEIRFTYNVQDTIVVNFFLAGGRRSPGRESVGGEQPMSNGGKLHHFWYFISLLLLVNGVNTVLTNIVLLVCC